MNRYLYFFTLLFFSVEIFAQTNLFTNNSPSDVIKIDSKISKYDFVPGEILIKFKDDVAPVLGKSTKGFAVTGVASVDAIFSQYKVTSAEKLFKNAKRLTKPEIFTTFNGHTFTRPSLHNIEKLKVEDGADMYQAIEALKNDPNVEYAEPNYIFSVVADKPTSPELNESEMKEWLERHPEVKAGNNLQSNNQLLSPNVVTPNDPLYSQQWGIRATQIDAVWDSTQGDTSQVIAILDSGVDWLHPDLRNNIWTNTAEIPDNGIDDDGDGFVDDVRGWDYINNDNNPMDDNSHGTHVAGIAAAEGNNGIGIAGVDWHAKIMPIKVFPSSGRGDAATITQGIIYASTHGATVINMSFGSYARSLTMEAALLNALQTAVLVSAAGNDHKNIYSPDPRVSTAFFPAALPYVLGVQSSQSSSLSFFSNYDPDGPVYSKFIEGLNYELTAPGTEIISTIPNGNYRLYSGTSMSAPLVSGAIALYRTNYPLNSRETMWGDLIHSSILLNIYLAMFSQQNSKPILDLVSYNLIDTLNNDDGDGNADAGETIQLWITVRNTWIQGDSIYAELRHGDGGDVSDVQILTDKILIGSISPYSQRTNELSPFKIYLNSDISNDKTINFIVALWASGFQDTTFQTIGLKVSNGTELSGILYNTTTLTPNKLWLINNSLRLASGAVLKILPGTHVILNSTFDNRGYVEAIGKRDSMIILENGISGNINKFVKFKLNGSTIVGDRFENCELDGGNIIRASVIKNCIINNFTYTGCTSFPQTDTLEDCQINNSILDLYDSPNVLLRNNFINLVHDGNPYPQNSKYNNFYKITNIGVYFYPGSPSIWTTYHLFDVDENSSNRITKNNFIIQKNIKSEFICSATGSSDLVNLPYQYWGTNDVTEIRKKIFDFSNNAGLPILNFEPKLTQPSDSAHGIVWKVLVDGIDPQDQANLMNPIGVGPHRFDVYFNRPMDTKYTPHLSFGVRAPYTQQSVADSSFWSPDSMIWTAYKTIKLYTGDGINRIRVADARDPEDFEIPVEDMRFEFLIDAAGLSSLDFNATSGLGKIKLDWKNTEDVPDMLGYNLYRFTNLTDTTYTDTLLINSELITDTTYTDFDVIPGNNYYYQYTTVNTDFTESDKSKIAGATALTSSPGDANGDLSVNVLDITSVVSYLLNQNPQPFIFDAADVDTNGVINVLDIVKTVNIILGVGAPKIQSLKSNAQMIVKDNSIEIKGGENISGIQLRIVGEGIKGGNIIPGNLLSGMEFSYNYNEDTLFVLAFNYKNNSFNISDGKLLSLEKGKIKKIDNVAASDASGNLININSGNEIVMIPQKYILYHNYPNPFNPTTTIRYGIPRAANVELYIYNILGQRIKTIKLMEQPAGYHNVIWNGTNDQGYKAASGIYIYQIIAHEFKSGKPFEFIDQKKMILLK